MRRPLARLWAGLASLVALSCTGCAPPAHEVGWSGSADPEETIDLVRLHFARNAFDNAWERTQARKLSFVLSEDVVFVPPGADPIKGRESVKWWFHDSSRGMALRDTYVSESLDLAGEFAVESWTIDRQIRRGEHRRRVRLKGLHIYERQADGRWLVSRRVWNRSPEGGE